MLLDQFENDEAPAFRNKRKKKARAGAAGFFEIFLELVFIVLESIGNTFS